MPLNRQLHFYFYVQLTFLISTLMQLNRVTNERFKDAMTILLGRKCFKSISFCESIEVLLHGNAETHY